MKREVYETPEVIVKIVSLNDIIETSGTSETLHAQPKPSDSENFGRLF